MAEDELPREPMGAEAQAIRDARLRQIMAEIERWAEKPWTYELAQNQVVYSLLELAYSFPKRADDLTVWGRNTCIRPRTHQTTRPWWSAIVTVLALPSGRRII